MFVGNCLLLSAQHALVFARRHDFAQYNASVLKAWWEIFPTFNVAKSEATWPKFCKIYY